MFEIENEASSRSEFQEAGNFICQTLDAEAWAEARRVDAEELANILQ